MEEQEVFFGQRNIRLEGLYADSGQAMGAVISHPHSLMGGEMRNSVVETLSECLFDGGMSTLRFNFRGVGKSTGAFDEGRGEQKDVLAALSFMEERGIREILPAGYSFGAWVNAGVLSHRSLLPALFVSPPIKLFDFNLQTLRGKVGLIICGDRDEYCPPERIRNIAVELSCRLDLIPDADHFFLAKERELAECINAYARSLRTTP
jgi:alpha/beta superfamily hydrolase